MIVDKIEHLPQYQLFREDELDFILDFCRKAVEEDIEEGRADFYGGGLYALVQIYDTRKREESVMEAHREYLDLQYIAEGEEYFYIHETSECKVKEDMTPEKDVIFLECGEPDVRVKAKKGMFVLLFPQDSHMPCIQTGRKEKVKKIVFKIRIKDRNQE